MLAFLQEAFNFPHLLSDNSLLLLLLFFIFLADYELFFYLLASILVLVETFYLISIIFDDSDALKLPLLSKEHLQLLASLLALLLLPDELSSRLYFDLLRNVSTWRTNDSSFIILNNCLRLPPLIFQII